jgi:hypothetical protein
VRGGWGGGALAAAAATAAAVLALGPAAPAAAANGPGLYGYVVTGSTYTNVTANWNVPTPTCGSASNYTSIWTGLDGYSSATTEQTGIEIDCAGGKATYFGWYDLYPANPVDFSNPVRPGDSITASVTGTKSGSFTLTLNDVTQGWDRTVHGAVSGAARSSAEAFVEDPGELVCSTVDFTGVTIDGTALGSLDPLKVTGGDAKIVVSPVSGSAFHVTWKT